MIAYLRVKVKSLAAEAQIIKREERRASGDLRAGLHNHRVHDVRGESRSAQLALAFLRGVPVTRLEGSTLTHPDWSRVTKLVEKYGEGLVQERLQRLAEWRESHPLSAA